MSYEFKPESKVNEETEQIAQREKFENIFTSFKNIVSLVDSIPGNISQRAQISTELNTIHLLCQVHMETPEARKRRIELESQFKGSEPSVLTKEEYNPLRAFSRIFDSAQRLVGFIDSIPGDFPQRSEIRQELETILSISSENKKTPQDYSTLAARIK